MFEIMRGVMGLWAVFGLLAVIWFLFREFDRRKAGDWFGAGASLPVIAWSLWLALNDLWPLLVAGLWG